MAHRLFKHAPTNRWIPTVQDDAGVTPGSAYVPDLAKQYGLPAAEITVLNNVATLPPDLETNAVPIPQPSPETIQKVQERDQAKPLLLPPFPQIDAAIDAALTAAQGGNWTPLNTILKRIAKIVRAATPVDPS